VQLLRQELSLGLAPLGATAEFAAVLETMDRAVARCRRQYAADLPEAPRPADHPGEDPRA